MLLAWNLFLTVSYSNLKAKVENGSAAVSSDENGVINNTVEGYTTDITETTAQVIPKLVTITAANDQSEHMISGVIYASMGTDTWILTASRWITPGETFTVQFDNGLSCPGELYGKDEVTDVSLILTHPDFETEPIHLGASTAIKQGEYVIALGGRNLHTQTGEVSFGVVSRPGQYYVGSLSDENEWITEGLLTDINLTENLIGGPIVNLSGQMIGILTTALADGRNTATAIGINEVVLAAEQIRTNKEITRGYLGIIGVNVRDLELYQKSAMNIPLDVTSGIVVAEVIEGSPAETAGIQPNDVITSFDDSTVSSLETLQRQLYLETPGSAVSVNIVRSGNSSPLTVILR